MKPPIANNHPIHPLLAKRWSGRAYAPTALPQQVLNQLFEAVRWAPSCYNEQPWRFVVAHKGTEAFEKLAATLKPANRTWAQNAPVLVLAVAKTHFSHNGQPNLHAWHDVGIAVAHLGIQATELDVNVHQMAGFNAPAATQAFSLPQGYEAVSVLALGYRAPAQTLEGVMLEKEVGAQQRKLQQDFVFEQAWQQPKPQQATL